MEMARKLLDGKFHEDDEDEDDLLNFKIGKDDLNRAIKGQTLEEIERKNRFEEFENQLHKVIHKEEKAKLICDEIPKSVRDEFDLPDKLGMYEINFVKIRKHDIASKK